MFDIPKEYENLVNIVFLIVTAAIAYHGLTFRRPDGESDIIWLYSRSLFFFSFV